ncbi:TPA: glycosyltransferase, partial [Campylobacter jejuni]
CFIWVRYSLIFENIKGFKIDKNLSYVEYVNKILDKERLKLRQKIFISQSIPHIDMARKQNPDLDIRMQIHASHLLHDELKLELQQLSKEYSWIEILFFHPTDKYNERALFESFLKKMVFEKDITPIACARLDDDDILSPEYFSIIKNYIKKDFLGFSFSAPRGFYAIYYNEKFMNFTKQYKPKIAIGLAHIIGWDKKELKITTKYHAFPGNHNSTDFYAPLILDASKEVFIRTLHQFNDDYIRENKYSKLEAFSKMFGNIYCNTNEVRKYFALLKYRENKDFGAKARIHSHLSYKLGQALIINSKSILGYIKMPFILSFIKEKHKAEQIKFEKALKENPNLALPPLENYADYKDALKEKECFTYKLGEAFIKAHKNWYGGGYIKFLLKDVPRLKREFRKK